MSVHSVTARNRVRMTSVHMLSRSGELRLAKGARFRGMPVFSNPNFTGISSKSGFAGPMPKTALATGTPSTMPAVRGGALMRGERIALRKLASKLSTPRVGFLTASSLLHPFARFVWNKWVYPQGFPGFEGMNAGWRKPVVGPGVAPGDYVTNQFDHHPNLDNPPESLLDVDDVLFPVWIRYWGDFGTDPNITPVKGDNWDTEGAVMPSTVARAGTATRYRKLRNLAPETETETITPMDNISFTLDTTFRNPIKIERDVPRRRAEDSKAKPKNKFVWLVMKKFANSAGELKEWADILASASGYIKGSMMLPKELRDTGKETQAKLYWVFFAGGLNVIDMQELAVLVVENEIEDAIFGFMGKLSKSAAQSLGMTVGPQTGLVM